MSSILEPYPRPMSILNSPFQSPELSDLHMEDYSVQIKPSFRPFVQNLSPFTNPRTNLSPRMIKIESTDPSLSPECNESIMEPLATSGLCINIEMTPPFRRLSWKSEVASYHAVSPSLLQVDSPLSMGGYRSYSSSISSSDFVSGDVFGDDTDKYCSPQALTRDCPGGKVPQDVFSWPRSSTPEIYQDYSFNNNQDHLAPPDSHTFTSSEMPDFDAMNDYNGIYIKEESLQYGVYAADDSKHESKPTKPRRSSSTQSLAIHECGVCGKTFAKTSNLNAHAQGHYPDRTRHQCMMRDCGRTFVRFADLKRHQQSVHERSKTHECQFCGKGFPRRDSVQRHEIEGCHLRLRVKSHRPRKSRQSSRSARTESAQPPVKIEYPDSEFLTAPNTTKLPLLQRSHSMEPLASIQNSEPQLRTPDFGSWSS